MGLMDNFFYGIPGGWQPCSCTLRSPCRCPTPTACPLCEEPYCGECLANHHKCTAQPQHLDVPSDVREPVEV